MAAYGADGEKIGAVADASKSYFVIAEGFLFTTDLFVPTSAVAAVLDDRVELNLTKEQIERATTPRRSGTAPRTPTRRRRALQAPPLMAWGIMPAAT